MAPMIRLLASVYCPLQPPSCLQQVDAQETCRDALCDSDVLPGRREPRLLGVQPSELAARRRQGVASPASRATQVDALVDYDVVGPAVGRGLEDGEVVLHVPA